MDAFMRALQRALAKITALRFCSLSVRVGMARSLKVSKREGRGLAVAKIIEFYIPNRFQWKTKWIPPQDRGKIIEFSLPTRKSA